MLKTIIWLTIFPFMTLPGCQKSESQEERNKKVFQHFIQEVVIDGKIDQHTINKYFDPDYIQLVDDKRLDLHDFVLHMRAVHKSVKLQEIRFEHMIAEGNKIATVHYPWGIKSNGKEVRAKVMALFEFKNNKLHTCNELTMITQGVKDDKDIGSKTH
jgi:predicted SnoaL-like aldol condensation-catalyzing enzyme